MSCPILCPLNFAFLSDLSSRSTPACAESEMFVSPLCSSQVSRMFKQSSLLSEYSCISFTSSSMVSLLPCS